MKILYLSQSLIPSRMANSVHVMKMCAAFARNGHEVTLIAQDNCQSEFEIKDDYQYYGVDPTFKIIKLKAFHGKYGRNKYAIEILKHVFRLNPDLVYGRFLFGCLLAAKIARKRVVFEIHAPKTSKLENRFFNILIHSSHLVRLVVITTALSEHFHQLKILDKSQIVVAPDGADSQPDNVETANLPPLTEQPVFHVGYVGHLYPGKGMELIASLVKLCPWASFHIIGGQQKDIEYWSDQLRNCSNIIFHGFISPSDVNKYIKACHVVLAPYQNKVYGYGKAKSGGDLSNWMSPLKIFEYMSLGKAILSSDLLVLREILTDRENCLMFRPDAPNDWATALCELRDDPVLRSSIGKRAKSDFEAKFTWNQRAQDVLSNL